MSTRNEKSPGVITRATEFMKLPAELLSGVPKLTLTGGNHALIENHSGLDTYSDNLIEVRGKRMRMRVFGTGLELVSMRRGDILITGQIDSIQITK